MFPEPQKAKLDQLRQEAAMRAQLMQQYQAAMAGKYTKDMIPFAQWLSSRQQGQAGGGTVVPKEVAAANKARMLEGSHTPMRLYHGTTATEGGKGQEAIRKLKMSKEGSLGSGVYMTPDHKFAGEYADASSSGNVLPLHAKITNPLKLTGEIHRDPMIEALIKLGMNPDKAATLVENAYEKKGYIGKEVMQRALEKGHDALMQYRDGMLQEVVHYVPRMIKSATGNRGTYDTSKEDLSMADGGQVTHAHHLEIEERPL